MSRCAALTLLLTLAATLARAECTAVAGDIAPGTREAGAAPQALRPTGDGDVDLRDVVQLVRAHVGLDALEWLAPEAACPDVPGDFAPGAVDDSTSPPTWHVAGEGAIDEADVDALRDAALERHVLADSRGGPFIASLSASEAAPFDLLILTGGGFDPTAADVHVEFTPEAGAVVLVPAVIVETSRIVVGVPPVLDATTGAASNSPVTVRVVQDGAASNEVGGLDVSSLPASAAPAGATAVGFLWLLRDAAQQAAADANGTDFDTPAMLAALSDAELDLGEAAERALLVHDGDAGSFALGALDGDPLDGGTADLILADRMLIAVLDAVGRSADLDLFQGAASPRALPSDPDCIAANARILSQDLSSAGVEALINSGQTPGQQVYQATLTCTPPAARTTLAVVGASAGIGAGLLQLAGVEALGLSRVGAALTYLAAEAWSGLLAIGVSLKNVNDEAARSLIKQSVEEFDRQVKGFVIARVDPTADQAWRQLVDGARDLHDEIVSPSPASSPWDGLWSGTYSYSNNAECNFAGGGSISMTLAANGSALSGPAELDGIEILFLDDCTLAGHDSWSGTLSGSITGDAASLSFSGSQIGLLPGPLSFSATGTRTGSSFSGLISIVNGSGPITMTRQP